MKKILSKQTRPGDKRREEKKVKRTHRRARHTSHLPYRSWCCCWRRAAAQERGRTRTSVWERPPPAPSSWTRTPAPPAASSWPSSPSSGASGWRLKRKHGYNLSPTDFSPRRRSDGIVLDSKRYLCSVVRRWAVAPDSPSSLVLDTAPSSALSSPPGSVCPAPVRSPPPPSAGPETRHTTQHDPLLFSPSSRQWMNRLVFEMKQEVTCMLVSRVSTDDRPSANRNGAGKPGGRACPSGDSSVRSNQQNIQL